MTELLRLRVAVEAPQHTGLAGPLDYTSEHPLAPGTLVRVPLGRRDVPGVVWPGASDAPPELALRGVQQALTALPPLGARWCELLAFAAGYYQRSVGEVALSVLPPELRKLDDAQLANRIKKLHKALADPATPNGADVAATELPPLSEQQAAALESIDTLSAELGNK